MRVVKPLLISLAAVTGVAALAWWFLVPVVIGREVRARLDDAGFAGARFEVGSVALDRVELLDVTLARGLELGDIEIGAGPWQLWRGHRADVVLHGPRVDPRALTGAGAPVELPFRRIAIEDGRIDSLAIRGTIDLRGETAAFDLTARSPRIRVGAAVIEDVAATIRGPTTALRACATGRAARAQLDACIVLGARTRETAELAWTARDAGGGWLAKGTGRLARTRDSVALEDGRVDVTVTDHTVGGFAIDRAVLHADVTGDLGARTFHARGELGANEVASDTVTFRGASVRFDLAGDGRILRSERDLVLSATSATVTAAGSALRVDEPVVTASGRTTLGGVEIAVGDGGRALRLVANVRGVPVDRVLAAATRQRARGTGVFDGRLVFALDAGSLALVGGTLAARAPGRLRVNQLASIATTDATGFALHRSVAAALADFDYSRLALTVAADPDLRLSLRGRGHRVPQALDIDVNVRIQ